MEIRTAFGAICAFSPVVARVQAELPCAPSAIQLSIVRTEHCVSVTVYWYGNKGIPIRTFSATGWPLS